MRLRKYISKCKKKVRSQKQSKGLINFNFKLSNCSQWYVIVISSCTDVGEKVSRLKETDEYPWLADQLVTWAGSCSKDDELAESALERRFLEVVLLYHHDVCLSHDRQQLLNSSQPSLSHCLHLGGAFARLPCTSTHLVTLPSLGRPVCLDKGTDVCSMEYSGSF